MGMGYQGYVKFDPLGSKYVILTTGASVNLVLEPIYSSSVWGAGWYNAAETAHYADNAIRYEGNIDFELQTNVWDLMEEWIVSKRAYSKSVEISPDGSRKHSYIASGSYDLTGMWNTSANFSTSQDSFVTVSAGGVALSRSEAATSTPKYIDQKKGEIVSVPADFNATNPLNPSAANVNPIPYWKTQAKLLKSGADPQSNLETVEWSVDVTQNHVVLYTANGNRLPTALLQGPMSATGNVTLYHEEGVFDPILGPAFTSSLTNPYMVANDTSFEARIQISPSVTIKLILPAVVVESDDYSITSAGDITNRSFTLKGLGGKEIASFIRPPFMMTDVAGNYVNP